MKEVRPLDLSPRLSSRLRAVLCSSLRMASCEASLRLSGCIPDLTVTRAGAEVAMASTRMPLITVTDKYSLLYHSSGIILKFSAPFLQSKVVISLFSLYYASTTGIPCQFLFVELHILSLDVWSWSSDLHSKICKWSQSWVTTKAT